MNEIKERLFLFSLNVLGIALFISSPSLAQDFLTGNINQILSEEVIFSGPNCHNTALRALNLVDQKRYIHEPEMRNFLEKNCFEIQTNNDSIKSNGSLSVIYVNRIPTPFHSFIHLGDTKVFTKNGVSKRALPEIQDYNEMYSIHEAALEVYCRINDIDECRIHVKSYNCTKPEEKLIDLELSIETASQSRKSFFLDENQNKILDEVDKIQWESNCFDKKFSLQSILLTIKLANMSSLGPEERFKTEALEDAIEGVYQSLDCMSYLPPLS